LAGFGKTLCKVTNRQVQQALIIFIRLSNGTGKTAPANWSYLYVYAATMAQITGGKKHLD